MTQPFSPYFLPDHIIKSFSSVCFPKPSTFWFSGPVSLYSKYPIWLCLWTVPVRAVTAQEGWCCNAMCPPHFQASSLAYQRALSLLPFKGLTVLVQVGLRISHSQLCGPTFVQPQPTTRHRTECRMEDHLGRAFMTLEHPTKPPLVCTAAHIY